MISDRIREHRKRQGLSQEKLAEALHVSRQTISNWETGVSSPSAAKLEELSRQLGVSVAELLGKEPQTPEAPPEQQPAPAPEPIPVPVHGCQLLWAIRLLAASVLAVAVVTCVGFYQTNQRIDRLLAEAHATPTEELAEEEVDSSPVESVTRQPLQPSYESVLSDLREEIMREVNMNNDSAITVKGTATATTINLDTIKRMVHPYEENSHPAAGDGLVCGSGCSGVGGVGGCP